MNCRVGRGLILAFATGTLQCRDVSINARCEKFRKDKTYKPVSNPPNTGVQGAAKLDWVTVWFLGLKVNETMSPTAAV